MIVTHAKIRPVCDIGQLTKQEKAALNAAVRQGALVKRKAPFAGNLGSMKTYYAASNEAFDAYQAGQVSYFDALIELDRNNRR